MNKTSAATIIKRHFAAPMLITLVGGAFCYVVFALIVKLCGSDIFFKGMNGLVIAYLLFLHGYRNALKTLTVLHEEGHAQSLSVKTFQIYGSIFFFICFYHLIRLYHYTVLQTVGLVALFYLIFVGSFLMDKFFARKKVKI